MQKLVSVNDRGYRIGEDHQNAKLSNSEVDLMRCLHEKGVSYEILAMQFSVSKSMIGRICRYEVRNQYPVAFKKVRA